MKYISTRGGGRPCTFSQAVQIGLAPDRGLFVPEELPDISEKLSVWEGLSYPQLAAEFLSLFAPEISKSEWHSLTAQAYGTFERPDVAPLLRLDEKTYVLEMFHGPTLAFKDFALQLLGLLYKRQVEKNNGKRLVVLGATSGDTGSAAIQGCAGQEFITIFILYPHGGPSQLQERQMTCTGADNVFAISIPGTFDDAQRIVKEAFGDPDFAKECNLSAVNSINVARLLAQCVYYLWAWFKLPPGSRNEVEFVIPTGNFGNALAGWLVKQMGLPIKRFRVATNENDILYRFFETGEYREGKVVASKAPSMDIQAASNFERLLFYMVGRDTSKVRNIMQDIKNGLPVQLAADVDEFRASRMADSEIGEAIRRVFQRYHYTIDPHTACAFKEMATDAVSVVLATAHPAKFPDEVRQATGHHPHHDSLDALTSRIPSTYSLPSNVEALKAFIRMHTSVNESECDSEHDYLPTRESMTRSLAYA